MTRRIVIIQGHPDPAGHQLLHAMADAYAEGGGVRGPAGRGGEARLPLLRTQQAEFETGALPPMLTTAQEAYAGRNIGGS